jgi:hypothetical protein
MKCKNCKEKFEPIKFLQKYCLKDECVRVWVESEKTKAWKKTKAKMKNDLETIQELIKATQIIFNKYIRLNDKLLGNPCFSCRKPLGDKYDAGHFFNANNHWNVRFDERNVHSQCVHCNQHLHGNLLEYRKQLEFYYGITWLNELEQDAKKTRKFTKDELKEIINIYKNKIKEFK